MSSGLRVTDIAYRSRRTAFVAASVAIILLAALLRFAELATLPQGMFRDEAFNVADELTISWSHTPIFFTANRGREALFFYWQSLFLHGLGVSSFSIRLAAASVALLTVALQIATMRRLFGWRVGFLSGLILATLYWYVQESRLGLRAITMPMFVLLLLLTLWWAERREQVICFAVSGAVAAIAAYAYTSARALPLVVCAACCYLLITRQEAWRKWLQGSLVVSLVYLLGTAPLVQFLFTHRDGLERLSDVTLIDPHQSVAQNTLTIAKNTIPYLRSFTFLGDRQWLFNLPGRPIFDYEMGALFYIGMLLLLFMAVSSSFSDDRAPRRYAAFLCAAALVASYLPGVLSVDAPDSPRVVGALPVVVVIPALTMDWAWRHLTVGWCRPFIPVAIMTVLAIQAARTSYDYFVTWKRSPGAAFAYGSASTAILKYVRAEHPRGSLFFSSYDADVIQLLAGQDTNGSQQIDARELLVLPQDTSRATYYFFDLADHSELERLLQPRATLVLNAVDRNAQVEVAHGYRVAAGQSLGDLIPPIDMITFDQRLAITGASIERDGNKPGVFRVLLQMRAIRPILLMRISVTATDDAGNVWGKQDSVTTTLSDPLAHSWSKDDLPGQDLVSWREGQDAISIHTLRLFAGTPPGQLTVQVNVYEHQGGIVVPINKDESGGKRTGLGTITVPLVVPFGGDNDFPPRNILAIQFADLLRLQAYHLSSSRPRQHDVERLDLVWTCLHPAAVGTRLDVELRDVQGAIAGNFASLGGLSPPQLDRCTVGVTVLDRRLATIGALWPPGPVTVQASLRDSAGEQVATSPLTTINVVALGRATSLPAMARSVHASFASGVALEGLSTSLAADGTTLAVDLVWRCERLQPQDYTVFAHILGSDGTLLAQHDGPPALGVWPTTIWAPGQIVVDHHVIPLSHHEVNASGVLEVGLYDLQTGERVAIDDPGSAQAQDGALRLPLGRPGN